MNAETGKEHTICPKCFRFGQALSQPSHFCSDPPGPPYSTEGFSGEFRCFMCNHPTCSLASRKVSEITLSPCYEKDCNGTIKLKRAEKTNTLFFGCNKYPSCRAIWWLPKNIKQGACCSNASSLLTSFSSGRYWSLLPHLHCSRWREGKSITS
jgi:ssDNA-binding Zn-finger/Zn-ribbon topoisomerase 1